MVLSFHLLPTCRGTFLPTSNLTWFSHSSYFQHVVELSFLLPTWHGSLLPPTSNMSWNFPSSLQPDMVLSFLLPTWHGSFLPPSNLTWFFLPPSFQPPNSILTPISCSSANWLSNRQTTNMENDWVSFINGINKMCRHFYNGPHPPLLPRILADILKSVRTVAWLPGHVLDVLVYICNDSYSAALC